MFNYIGVAIGGGLIVMATFFIGGPFLLIAWGRVLAERTHHGVWSIPAALYTFTASVCLEPLWLIAPSYASPEWFYRQFWGVTLPHLNLFAFTCIGFVCLLTSVVLIRKGSGAIRTTVMAGSITLIVFYLLGFVLIIFS